MAKVSQLNLKRLHERHLAEFNTSIGNVVAQSAFIGGREVEMFEKTFAEWIGPDNEVISCANGTDAITLATLAMNLPKGSEAILPAMTYFATAEGVKHAGLNVKLVDVTSDTWVMNPELLEKAMTSKTKLIVPVHLYGQMAEMDKIRVIADKYRCKILEDASQAHGARWKNQPVGHYSDIATYSLYPGKNLGAFGDGGLILTKNLSYSEQCKKLRNHGGIIKYVHETVGFNSLLDNLQAAVLNVKMKYIESWNQARRVVAKRYQSELAGLSGLRLPRTHQDATHIYHQYVVIVKDRQKFIDFMNKKEVETGVHYPKTLNQLEALRAEFQNQAFPESEKLAAGAVSLPMCPTLTESEVTQVISSIREYFNKASKTQSPELQAA